MVPGEADKYTQDKNKPWHIIKIVSFIVTFIVSVNTQGTNSSVHGDCKELAPIAN